MLLCGAGNGVRYGTVNDLMGWRRTERLVSVSRLHYASDWVHAEDKFRHRQAQLSAFSPCHYARQARTYHQDWGMSGVGKQQDTRLNEHKVTILRCIFVSIIIASDPQSVRSWGSDAINYFAIIFRSPGSEITLRKSDSFRSCSLDCCCSGAEFFCALHNDTCFNTLYVCY